MKRLAAMLIAVAVLCVGAYGQTNVNNTQLSSNPSQVQNTNAIGGGNADSSSNSNANSQSLSEGGYSSASAQGGSGGISWSTLEFSPTTISNYEGRTAPIGTYPPYLPGWNHGGWGTINAYFSNGPTNNETVYERTFDTANPDDARDLKGVLHAMSYAGPLEVVGGMFNGLVKLFGGPDRTHHGRGIEIANSLLRDRRPEDKPLFVLIDSNVDAKLLEDAGYAYVGRLSLEGKINRNWDQVYNATVAEALPWDVDILLISGGMKGVTVGSNTTFPSASLALSQSEYSVSLGGGYGKGITEGKGEAMISAAAFRYCPEMLRRRSIPAALYDRIRVRPKAVATAESGQLNTSDSESDAPTQVKAPVAGVEVSRELYDRAGLRPTAPPVETTMMR